MQYAQENRQAYIDACNAVISRGGTLASGAPSSELANSIANLPQGQSFGHLEVESNSKRVIVPANAEPIAQMLKIGGASFKSNNILKLRTLNETQGGLTITTNADGSYTFNGTLVDDLSLVFWEAESDYPHKRYGAGSTITAKVTGLEKYSSLDHDVSLWFSSNALYDEEFDYDMPLFEDSITDGRAYTHSVTEGFWLDYIALDIYGASVDFPLVFDNVTFTIMVNEGTTALPYEPYFEGLRASKVQSIVSEGANKVKVLGWSAKGIYGDKTALSLTNNYNTTINTTEAVNRIEVTQSNWVEGGGYSSPNGEFNGKISKTLTAGKTYIFSADIELTHCPLNVPNIRIQIDNNAMFAFNSLKPNQKVRVSCSFVYTPSAYDICRLFFSLNGNSIILSDIMITDETVTDITYKPFRASAITTMPDSVKNLEGFGDGINTDYYNYVEWRDGRCYFVRTCKKLVFDGTERWYAGGTSSNGIYRVYYPVPLNADFVSNATVTPCICNHYDSKSPEQTYKLIEGASLTATNMYIYDSRYTTNDISLWKAYVAELYAQGNPLTVIYALAEPIETDITDLMTIDNAIVVEAFGSVEFVTESGKDIENKISYLINAAGGA